MALKREDIPDALIVDSDNFLDHFLIIYQNMLSEYCFYTLTDWRG